MSVRLVPLPEPETDQAATWATRINAATGASVDAVIALGRELHAAKDALEHGEWERLFRGHPDVVEEPVRFSVNTAQRIMAIAGHGLISKAAHAQLLPSSWMTLYELTKSPDDVLAAALEDGRVRPDMTRSEAVRLYKAAPEPPGPFDCPLELSRYLRTTIGRVLDRTPNDTDWRAAFCGILDDIAADIRKTGGLAR